MTSMYILGKKNMKSIIFAILMLHILALGYGSAETWISLEGYNGGQGTNLYMLISTDTNLTKLMYLVAGGGHGILKIENPDTGHTVYTDKILAKTSGDILYNVSKESQRGNVFWRYDLDKDGYEEGHIAYMDPFRNGWVLGDGRPVAEVFSINTNSDIIYTFPYINWNKFTEKVTCGKVDMYVSYTMNETEETYSTHKRHYIDKY